MQRFLQTFYHFANISKTILTPGTRNYYDFNVCPIPPWWRFFYAAFGKTQFQFAAKSSNSDR